MASPSSLPTSTSSLILPLASQNPSHVLSSLKRATLSISNRLNSIHLDSAFVQDVASSYGLPLVSNERCGSWYIPPSDKVGSAYFKSTDGHWGQWGFSTRRLNLQVLEIVGRYGGCIIVDSTRRGKRMPDALSKTVPIWCAVINRLLFAEMSESHNLSTPVEAVGESEHVQIEARLDSFVEDAKSLELDIRYLRSVLKKPLRPSWVTPDYPPSHRTSSTAYQNIICCTASRRLIGAEASEDGYIQGAGDDSEGWSYGLTPALFWKHKEQLLNAVEEDMPALIQQLRATNNCSSAGHGDAVQVGSTSLYIGTLQSASNPELYEGIISCSADPPSTPNPCSFLTRESRTKILHLLCGEGKLGSRALRSHLPRLLPFITSLPDKHEPPKILVVCSTGRDLSVGVALAILCLFFDDDYSFNLEYPKAIDKVLVRRRLAWITTAKPDANPSRATLQSVHTLLMSPEANRTDVAR